MPIHGIIPAVIVLGAVFLVCVVGIWRAVRRRRAFGATLGGLFQQRFPVEVAQLNARGARIWFSPAATQEVAAYAIDHPAIILTVPWSAAKVACFWGPGGVPLFASVELSEETARVLYDIFGDGNYDFIVSM